MNNYKYLGLITMLYITFQLVSDVTASKIISFGIFTASVTVLYYPFTFIISDILTEVYGYSVSRKTLWTVIMASFVAGVVYQVATSIPSVFGPAFDQSYSQVLGTVFRIMIAGWLATWAGGIVNDYVLAKMKIKTKGKHLFVRTIGSTVAGEGVNTIIFYTVGLWGILGSDLLVTSILSAWFLKTCVEIFLTPVTYKVIAFLKKEEGIDHYDHNTDFNPLKY